MLPSGHSNTSNSLPPSASQTLAPPSPSDALLQQQLDLSMLPTAPAAEAPATNASMPPEPAGVSSFSLKRDALVTKSPASVAKPQPAKSAEHTKVAEATKSDAGTNSDKPRLPTNLPIDFIDLYEVLSMSRDAEPTDLRKRISELYLDAQKNLDHRNAKKKLRYQELFEVILPQSRYLLLDPERRVEYDKYLDDYRRDEIYRAEAEHVIANDPILNPVNTVQAVQAKARVEEELTPEQLEERRLSLWKKWEESLAAATDPLEQVQFSMPALEKRATIRKEYMEHALIESHEVEKRRARDAAKRRLKEEREAEDAERRASEDQIVTRRHREYKNTADNLAAKSRFYWAIGLGIAVLAAGFVLRRVIDVFISVVMRTNPFSPETVDQMVLILTGAACCFAAWKGAQTGTELIKGLVRDLAVMRKEAENLATPIAKQKLERGNPNATGSANQYEFDLIVRQESLELLRQIQNTSLIIMLKRNASTIWSLVLSISTFILGSGVLIVGDFQSGMGITSPIRGLYYLVGLAVVIAASLRLVDVGKDLGRKQNVGRDLK